MMRLHFAYIFHSFNKEVWNDLKAKFLEAYPPKYSAKALCICFQDLKQKPNKNVQDFYNRVSNTFRNANKTKTDHTITYVGRWSHQFDCDTVMQQGVTRMQLLVLNMVFLGRLREYICTRVLEDGLTKSDDSAKAAREIESIINDKRRGGAI
jgi:hypothetical protein